MDNQDQNVPSDFLETISPSNPSTADGPEDSPDSNFDAGLDDELSDEAEIGGNGDQPLSGEMEADDQDKSSDEYSRREIPITDLPNAAREDYVHSPELADMNVPGEIDIEDLDEDAVSESLPPDARLDPLEN